MKRAIFLLLPLLLLSHPLDAQWRWANPLPEGNEFFDVTFLSASEGWMVGGNVSILHTTDGGASWTSVANPLRTTPFNGLSVVFTNTLTGLISLTNGTLLRTTNAGTTWTVVSTPGGSIQRLRRAPDGSVWGVGNLGTIARSTDAGLTWTVFTTGITTVVYDVAFPTATKAVAVCGAGTFLASTNAGATWTSSAAKYALDLVAVTFTDAVTGVALQKPKYVLRTTDGGASWTDTAFAASELRSVSFMDRATGYVVSGERGGVFRTSDGGASWQFQTIDPALRYAFRCVRPFPGGAVACGDGGSIFLSTDGGVSFAQRGSAITRNTFNAVTSFSDSAAVVFGDGVVFATTDAGATWRGNGTVANLHTGYAWSDTRYIGGGPSGLVLTSTDAGATWKKTVLASGGQIERIVFTDQMNGWLAGAHGTVARTTNAGATWQAAGPSVTTDFYSIAAVTANDAWVVGSNGEIYHTSTGGTTWEPQSSGSTQQLLSAHFTSVTDGWIGGQTIILNTTDGGKNWAQSSLVPGLDNVFRVTFTDAQQGYFMMSRSIARTNDGGHTFYRSDYPATGLRDLAASADGVLWLVGQLGTILRYQPTAAVYMSPTRLDFGNVAVKKERDLDVVVTNLGEVPLHFSNVAALGTGFLYVKGNLADISPGGNTTLTFGFAPADTGVFNGVATIFSSATIGIPYIDLVGRGIPAGTPAFTHSPATVDFGKVLLGEYAQRTVILQNTSSQNILLSRQAVTGGDSIVFQIALETRYYFAPSYVDSVLLMFTPVTAGKFVSSLLIQSNDIVEPYYMIPLVGEAITPTFRPAPGQLNFGTVTIPGPKALPLVLHNAGSAPLTIAGFLLQGADSADFLYTPPAAFVIAPGDSTSMNVSFAPKSAGAKSARLLISSDDLLNPTFAVALSGNGATTAAERLTAPRDFSAALYPNPVSPSRETVLRVELAAASDIDIAFFDALGRRIGEIVSMHVAAGITQVPVTPPMRGAGLALCVVTARDARGVVRVSRIKTVIGTE